MSLELKKAFGLRREESVKFSPSYADPGDCIVTVRQIARPHLLRQPRTYRSPRQQRPWPLALKRCLCRPAVGAHPIGFGSGRHHRCHGSAALRRVSIAIDGRKTGLVLVVATDSGGTASAGDCPLADPSAGVALRGSSSLVGVNPNQLRIGRNEIRPRLRQLISPRRPRQVDETPRIKGGSDLASQSRHSERLNEELPTFW